ncbi:MAG: hypothetical protein PHD20_02870 [Clostridia bacterium]|nr:hypothetical protein [Clostridia bacterium]
MYVRIICRSFQTERNVNGTIKPVNRIGFFWEDTKKPVKQVGCCFQNRESAERYAEANIPQTIDFSKCYQLI